QRASGKLQDATRAHPAPAPRERDLRQRLQATGANHTVLVFRDALATEEPPALRTTRDGFAGGVVKAPLVAQTTHGPSIHELVEVSLLLSSPAAPGHRRAARLSATGRSPRLGARRRWSIRRRRTTPLRS